MEPDDEGLELRDLAPENDCDWAGGVPLFDPEFDEEEWQDGEKSEKQGETGQADRKA